VVAFLEELKTSAGGIEALLLGIRHLAKVKKIAAMTANLYAEGIYPEILSFAKSIMMDSMPAGARETPQGNAS
jgi:hypothetical protein